MSFTECTVSELELFGAEKLQTSILNRKEVVHYPLNSLDGTSSIEFFSSGQISSYRDLSNVFLKLKVQLVKQDKTPYNSTLQTNPDIKNDQPGFVANTLHSLFRSIQVVINNRTVCNHDFYHYKAYLELLTNYRPAVISTNFEASGAILDTEKKMDDLKDNVGLTTRKILVEDSKTYDLYGRLSLDLSNQPRLIINNLDIRFILQLESESFVILEKETQTSKINILDAALYLTHCDINPNVLMYHTQLLGKTPVKYPFVRTVIKAVTLSSGIQSTMLENVFTGILPTFLMMTFIENAAFTGNRKKNPLNMKHYNVKSIQLYKNNEPIPQEPLEFIDSNYARAYTHFLNNIDVYNANKDIAITKKNYIDGYFLTAFNLSPLSQITDCNSVFMDGSLRIQINFNASLNHTVTALFYASVPDVLEVDSNYNVSTKFQ